MIRRLRLLDIPTYLLSGRLKRSNRAHTLDTVANLGPTGFPLIDALKIVRLPKRHGCSWVSTPGKGINALAAASPRSGPRSWELTHLIASRDDDGDVLELLETVLAHAAGARAERVFLRLAQDDPITETCRLAGFFPCFRETLYRRGTVSEGEFGSDAIRLKEPADDHALFRLYCAATPSEVRSQYGMTLEQWQSSHENYMGQTQEFVYERDGSVRGWLSVSRRFRTGLIAAMVHPDDIASTGFLLRYLMAKFRAAKDAYCIVPEYQPHIKRRLHEEGFQPAREYVTLVRVMTATVGYKSARASATTAPI